ncbi:MAG: sugar ABC transporter permease [Fibromonadaceae bacterium]|jgi:multiple sugar transport system permease protein|nr:sugar ABC transporter permease [Fibromonadaceae bacterium]
MKKWNTRKIAFFFALPPGILLLLFLVLPVLCNIVISAFDIGNNPGQWFESSASFDNYKKAVMQDGFINAVKNSIIYTLVTTLGVSTIGLAAALFLKQPFKGRTLVIALMMLSWIVPSYVVGIFFGYMFQQDNSVVNFILFDVLRFDAYSSWLGFQWNYNDANQLIIPRWLDGKYSVLTIAIPAIWHYWPYSMLLFLGGLNVIKGDIEKAAKMDGANRINRFLHITLPILKPALIAVIVQSLITNIYSFNIVVMMFGNGTIIPSKSADIIVPYIFRTSFQYWNLGIGAALSTMLTLAVGIAVIYYYRNLKGPGDAET